MKANLLSSLFSILADLNNGWSRFVLWFLMPSAHSPSLWEPFQLTSPSTLRPTAFLINWQGSCSCLSFPFLWFSLYDTPGRQNSQFGRFSLLLLLFLFLLIISRSDLQAEIWGPVCISKSQSILSLTWTDSDLCIYVVHLISFQTFFVQAFRIIVDSWKNVIAIHLMRYLTNFLISASNEQLQQQLEYTLIKPDRHGWWISKMQSGREDTLEERYVIKFCFKLGKNATETYGMLQAAFEPSYKNRASVFEWHKRFKEGKESVRDDERCRRSKEVNRPELIGQRVRVRVTMLRF